MSHYTQHTKALFSKYRQMDSAALHRALSVVAVTEKPVGHKGLGMAKPDHFIAFLREIV